MSLLLLVIGVAVPEQARAVSVPPVLGTVGVPLATPAATVDMTGLTAPVTIVTTPPLPGGLAVDAGDALVLGTGNLSGTPTTAAPMATYTVTATDSSPTPVVLSVDVPIEVVNVTPIADITTAFGQPLSGSAPVATEGFGSGLQFTLSGAPTWLTISSTGVLSGTPTAAQPATAVTVTASDTAGATATRTFSLVVLDALSPPTQALVGVVGSPLATAMTPLTSSSTGTFTIAPDVSARTGLSFDPLTGTISGTPSKPIGPTAFTVTLTPAPPAAALQATVTVTVDAVLGTTPLPVTGTVGSAIPAVIGYASTVATAAGLVGPFAYSTVPGLPGLTAPGDITINPSTGAITGRPSAAVVGAKYLVSVTDKTGAKATGPIVITINGQLVPTSQALVGTVGATVTSRSMAQTGMTAPISYSITPTVPAGLTFSPSTGAVSGIPRAVQAATTYDILATDANGAKAAAKLTITVGKALISPPVIGAIQPGPKAGSIIVNFTPPRLAPSDQSYTVQVFDSTGADLVTSVDVRSSPVTIDGLTPGEIYQVVVVANATTAYDRIESLPKSAVASTDATSVTVTATAAAGTVAPKKPVSAATLGQLGLLLGIGSQVSSAKSISVAGLPSRKQASAPVARMGLNSFTRLVVSGVRLKGNVTFKVRSTGAWLVLGRAKANAKHVVKVPVFAARQAGSYLIQMSAAKGKPLYVRVVVSAAKAT